tara:strand:+ start:292 stop:537 length:246 start_codon:yes stop_codon:yes gene_type:complete
MEGITGDNKVFLLVYSHKHGHDYSIYKSYSAALLAAEVIVSEYRDEFVPGSTEADKSLRSEWFAVTGGAEELEIFELDVQN